MNNKAKYHAMIVNLSLVFLFAFLFVLALDKKLIISAVLNAALCLLFKAKLLLQITNKS